MEENEIKPEARDRESIYRLFSTEKPFKVFANEYAGKMYYNAELNKINYDGQKLQGRCRIEFVKCAGPADGTIIRIKNAKEDWYMTDKFHMVFKVVIFDYDIVQNTREVANQAINDFYKDDSSYEDDLPF